MDIINIQDQDEKENNRYVDIAKKLKLRKDETIQSGLVKSLSSLQPYKQDDRKNNTLSVNIRPNSISMMNKMRPVTAGYRRNNRPASSFNPNSSEKLLSISSYQPPKYLIPSI